MRGKTDMTHTPGPWWFDGDWHRLPTIFGADRKTRIAILSKSGMTRDARTEAQEADAHLIAAAPELLEALRLIATMQDGEQAWWARDIANAAIAKATLRATTSGES